MADLSGQYLGRYYLSERLGEGGMAVVYKAYDTRLERDVALKIIRTGAFPTDSLGEVLKRFEREAKSLAKLSHPNIVKVYDYGEHEGSPYLVMEYLPGGTLKKVLGRPIPWQEAIRLLLPVARGVAYAHQRGILHRDIKPANILITESGEPMLSDFGIAKLFEGDQATALTGSGMAIGTPEYMAPEQWTGMTSPQSDLYSLGIVLYEMVTGRKPYVADTPAAILIKQATEALPAPRKYANDLPEILEGVVIKALARDPNDRYKDINTFIGALDNLWISSPVMNSMPQESLGVTNHSADVLPTKIPSRVGPIKASQRDDEVSPSASTPAQRGSSPSKFSYKWLGLFAIGIIVIGAIWLGLPMIGQLLSSAPNSAATELQNNIPAETAYQAEIRDAKDDRIVMVLVDAGEFFMGSEQYPDEMPFHPVYIDAYYIDKYEVTNLMYQTCVSDGVCEPPQKSVYYDKPLYKNHPVVYVNWEMANTFCAWRGNGNRLPTEAEWEKAARWDAMNGRSFTFPWGDEMDEEKVNYNRIAGGTTIFTSFSNGKSPYGVYNMAGNVMEWVFDWYDIYPGGRQSASSAFGEKLRVVRGGAWNYSVEYIRASDRTFRDPDFSSDYLGFRCARNAAP